nr:leucine-rich repeat extensin-like protein 1 [Labrus bergylta]
MSRVQKFRLFVTQRLHVAVEDILAAFEETLVKYEQEAALTQEVISRQHALLCALNKPLMEAAQSGDVITKQLLVSNDSVPLEHQDQETPEPPLVREEGGPPPHLAEDDIIHFTYSTRCSVRPDQEVHLVSSETEDSEDYSQDPPDHPSASPHRHPSVSQPPSASPHRHPSVSQPPSASPTDSPLSHNPPLPPPTDPPLSHNPPLGPPSEAPLPPPSGPQEDKPAGSYCGTWRSRKN